MIMIYYDMSLTQSLPQYSYLLVAIGILIFQTFDGVDGKQARRTGSSSPLGKLFDHGCDSLAWGFANMSVVSCLCLGTSFQSVFIIYASTAPFYLTNLLESYSGVYEYKLGLMNCTIREWNVAILNIVTFFYGSSLFQWKANQQFPFLFLEILKNRFIFKDFVMIIIGLYGFLYSLLLLQKLSQQLKEVKDFVIVFFRIAQLVAVFFVMYMFDGRIEFVRNNIAIAYYSCIILYSLMTTKLIVNSMAKMDSNILNLEFLVFVPYFYLQWKYDGTAESEQTLKFVFYATFVTILALFLKFVHCLISQLTEYLGIYCFIITRKREKSE